MAYPGPPGVSSQPSLSSLPPRPPPSKLASGFKPAFSAAPAPTTGYSGAPSASGYRAPAATYSSAPSYAPQYGAPPSYANNQPPPASLSTGRGYGPSAAPSYTSTPQTYGQGTYYGAKTGVGANYATPPQIRNPFPQPASQAAGADYNPEEAAAIAQWQSAYMPRQEGDATAAGRPSGGAVPAQHGASSYAVALPAEAATANGAEATAVSTIGPDGKKKTVYREGGGKKWADDSLLEWDPSHLRLFVGNLAGETTNDSLLKAFARWPSVQKAKVVRDNRTSKSKGYGFVSFSDADDFFQAAKEMNGKYIQSHPVIVRKSTTEIKPHNVKDDKRKHGKGNKGKGGNKGGHGSGAYAEGVGIANSGYDSPLTPVPTGITKPGQKTKGGLKLLG